MRFPGGGGGGLAPQVMALEFYGDSPRGNVRHGSFWTPEVNLGQFFWEAWLRPTDNSSRYWLCDGAGGSHALLLGFTQGAPGDPMLPFGNMWTGATTVGFGADNCVYPGEWCH